MKKKKNAGDSSPNEQFRASQDPIEQLARQYADDFQSPQVGEEEPDESAESDELSLEELSQTYSRLLRRQNADDQSPSRQAPEPSDYSTSQRHAEDGLDDEIQIFDPLEAELEEQPDFPVSPQSVIEAVLLVGRPDGGPISATEIAGLMRGVSEAEVDQLIRQLNADYVANHRAMRIVVVAGAYKMQLADDLGAISDKFLGPAREIKLNQAAIDCLALVAYQPGVTREKLDQQRGQTSGPILNQLVRRELLEMRREKEGKKLQPHYYPTPRLLALAGLQSLDDLPTVEDWDS